MIVRNDSECNACKGKGVRGFNVCDICDGTGYPSIITNPQIFENDCERLTCNYCQGKGKLTFDKCNVCKGYGDVLALNQKI